jgi:hypothetical protein
LIKEQKTMRTSTVLPVIAALVVTIGSSLDASAHSKKKPEPAPKPRPEVVTRDHRQPYGGATVNDHSAKPTINDHRKASTETVKKIPFATVKTSPTTKRYGGGVTVTSSGTPRQASKPKAKSPFLPTMKVVARQITGRR